MKLTDLNNFATRQIPQNVTNILFAAVLSFTAIATFLVILNTAWMSDDAYITYRSIYNFTSHGMLSWNLSERVQSFSHPFWMIVLTPFYLFTSDAYYTPIILSLLFSMLTLAVLAILTYRFKSILGFLGLVSLLFSKAFIDFSTSGLENALSHFLLAVFFVYVLSRPRETINMTLMTFIASLTILTRFDLAILVLPPLVYIVFISVRSKSKKLPTIIKNVLYGFSPLIAWLFFSTLYYGSPFPNTYFAKLQTGLPFAWYAKQGIGYFKSSFLHDPTTIVMIALTIVIVVLCRNKLLLITCAGIALYLAYTIRIGGCFMSGRFFTAPLSSCVAILIFVNTGKFRAFTAALISIALLILSPISTLNDYTYIVTNRDDLNPEILKKLDEYRIGSERIFYCGETGLFSGSKFPQRINQIPPMLQAGKSVEKVAFTYMAGIPVYLSRGRVNYHFVDELGLSDPLLSKIPIMASNERIGHFRRPIPRGYMESLKTDSNRIANPFLKQYYEKVRLITRGSLFSPSRLLEIVKMNLGFYDHLIAKYETTATERELAKTPSNRKLTAYKPYVRPFSNKGLTIILNRPRKINELEIGISNNTSYKISFLDETEATVQTNRTSPSHQNSKGPTTTIKIALDSASTPISAIKITPDFSRGPYFIAHFKAKK